MTIRKKTGGRREGTPNKVTAEARKAIALLIDGNIQKLAKWLDCVAEGVKDHTGKFIVPPNPAKAFQLLSSVLEYNVPKLGRVEVINEQAAPQQDSANFTIFRELLDSLKRERQLQLEK